MFVSLITLKAHMWGYYFFPLFFLMIDDCYIFNFFFIISYDKINLLFAYIRNNFFNIKLLVKEFIFYQSYTKLMMAVMKRKPKRRLAECKTE